MGNKKIYERSLVGRFFQAVVFQAKHSLRRIKMPLKDFELSFKGSLMIGVSNCLH